MLVSYTVYSVSVLCFRAFSEENQKCKHTCTLYNTYTITCCVVQVIAWTVLWWERREGVRSSGLFTIFWLCLVLYSALKMRSLILLSEDRVSF